LYRVLGAELGVETVVVDPAGPQALLAELDLVVLIHLDHGLGEHAEVVAELGVDEQAQRAEIEDGVPFPGRLGAFPGEADVAEELEGGEEVAVVEIHPEVEILCLIERFRRAFQRRHARAQQFVLALELRQARLLTRGLQRRTRQRARKEECADPGQHPLALVTPHRRDIVAGSPAALERRTTRALTACLLGGPRPSGSSRSRAWRTGGSYLETITR
jgi:hypothetical protein